MKGVEIMDKELSGFNAVVNMMVTRGEMNSKEQDGDYINEEDGLLYCGKCNTPKQTRIELFGEIRMPYCLCECEAMHRDKERAEAERKQQQMKIQSNRRAAFPMADMELWTFENDDMMNPKISNAMRRYVEHFDEMRSMGQGILLWGECGTGKTYHAACVANALIDAGYSAIVTNFSRIINTIQGMNEGKQEYLDSLNRCSLLVFDDLGIERETEYMREQVYNIIDSRYRAGRPMIITTNLSIKELKNQDNIDKKRIYDRILERCTPIEVNGANRRYKKINANHNHMMELLGLD